MKRFNEEYFAMVKEEQGEDVANLCKVVHEFLNDITERQECKESMSFSEEKSKLTELVAPFGLFWVMIMVGLPPEQSGMITTILYGYLGIHGITFLL